MKVEGRSGCDARESRRARPLTATAGARAQVVHGLVALKGACSVLLCCQGGFSPLLLFPAAARFLKARRRPHGVLVAAARAARAPLLDDLVDGDLARIRGSCTSFQKEPKHLFAFGSVITADLTSFVGLPARRRAMRILVSWYPVRPYAHIRLYTRSHLSVSVAPRAASPRAGAPPGAGACRQPGLPGVYTISVTCRLPKVDLSVTEVVYTTKVVYLPVLINPGSQFDS